MQKRLTKQKVAIFQELASRCDHPSATRLYEDLKDRIPGLSKATVFRILKNAADEGEIMRLHLGTEDRFDGAREDHCHLICKKCLNICDVPFPEMKLENLEEKSGYVIFNRHIEMYGYCLECQKEIK